MYDILVFLFENCQQAELAYDSDRVAKKLSAAGFTPASQCIASLISESSKPAADSFFATRSLS